MVLKGRTKNSEKRCMLKITTNGPRPDEGRCLLTSGLVLCVQYEEPTNLSIILAAINSQIRHHHPTTLKRHNGRSQLELSMALCQSENFRTNVYVRTDTPRDYLYRGGQGRGEDKRKYECL